MDMLRKWQLAIAGIAAAGTALINSFIAQFDSDATTEPNWNTAIALLITAFGLFQARPNSVSSEEAKVK